MFYNLSLSHDAKSFLKKKMNSGILRFETRSNGFLRNFLLFFQSYNNSNYQQLLICWFDYTLPWIIDISIICCLTLIIKIFILFIYLLLFFFFFVNPFNRIKYRVESKLNFFNKSRGKRIKLISTISRSKLWQER